MPLTYLPYSQTSHDLTRNSSGDEIANVNFLYDDIVYVLQNTIDLLSCTVSKLWLIIRQIFASERECLTLLLSRGVIPCQKLHCLAYISAAESIRISSTTFTQSALKATEFGEITQPLGPITPFKVIQDHRLWYQSKAHIRLPNSD